MQLSIDRSPNADKKLKIVTYLEELMPQVKSVSSCMGVDGFADTTVGKLSAISLGVPRGRAALYIALMFNARTITAESWPGPFGKPRRGAKVRTGSSKAAVPEAVWKACVAGLSFWQTRFYSRGMPLQSYPSLYQTWTAL